MTGHGSIWLDGAERRRHQPLDGDRTADVVVVGGGITGLTAAVEAARRGAEVVVLEARRIGGGTTGHSTAKVSALQGTRHRTIRSHHGAATARLYAASQRDAMRWMDDEIAAVGIDCGWEPAPAVTYATTADGARLVAAEQRAAVAAGLDIRRDDSGHGLPFPVTAAIVMDDQRQFDPVPYVRALARTVAASGRGAVHEDTRVTAVQGHGSPRVVTDAGTIAARYVVVATLSPILHRGLFYARADPSASYVTVLETRRPLPEGMFLSAESPARSLRRVTRGDRRLAMVGGAGHTTGREPSASDRIDELVDWADEHFGVVEVVDRWMAHDLSPVDHLPWVGPATALGDHVLVGAGFEKWGMTGGTAAGLVLADMVTEPTDDARSQWSAIFDPNRASLRALPGLAQLNAEVGAEMAKGWVTRGVFGASADENPVDAAVRCTHLGGPCRWNDADRTWDCPLHGSRFAADGELLAGPATEPLPRKNPS